MRRALVLTFEIYEHPCLKGLHRTMSQPTRLNGRFPTGWTACSIGWCTTLIVSKCAANQCASNAARMEKSEQRSAGQKPWKRRAKNALGNCFAIPTFPHLQQQA